MSVAVALTALLLVQAAPVAAPVGETEALITCVDGLMETPAIDALTTAMVDDTPPPPAFNPQQFIGSAISACTDGGAEAPRRVILSFSYLMIGRGQEIMATRLGLSGQRRAAFEAVLRPHADTLVLQTAGRAVPGPEITPGLLTRMRTDLARAGFTMPVSDYFLSSYVFVLARDRLLRPLISAPARAQP